jgi:membrane associated rhomboid family serine protease
MAQVYTVSPKQKRSFFSGMKVNTILILINVILFIIFSILISTKVISIDFISLKPSNVLNGNYLWTFLTSMFMHANFFHLFVNMFSLFFIGSLVERIIGRRRYFWFYILSGIFAGLVYSLFAYFLGSSIIGARIFGSPDTLAVGASGAIFGLAGLLAVLIPKKKVYLIAGPLIAIIFQSIFNVIFPSSSFANILDLLVTVYIFFAIFSMLSFNNQTRKISVPIEMPFWLLPIVAIVPLVIIGLFVELPIGNTAHLGGFLFGLGYGFYLKFKYKNKTKMISKFFS